MTTYTVLLRPHEDDPLNLLGEGPFGCRLPTHGGALVLSHNGEHTWEFDAGITAICQHDSVKTWSHQSNTDAAWWIRSNAVYISKGHDVLNRLDRLQEKLSEVGTVEVVRALP